MTLTAILIVWSIPGILAGMMVRISPKMVVDYPAMTVLLCLYLGSVWWVLYVVAVIRYWRGDRT